MKRLRSLVMFAMLAGAMLPAMTMDVSAQEGADLCEGALTNGEGEYAGYTVVYFTGGPGSQIVLGTDGPDVLSGGSGHDVLCGLGGDDVLEGGSGNDVLVGGNGYDELYGGSGNDTLYGTTADYVLNEGSGHDDVFATFSGATFDATFTACNSLTFGYIADGVDSGPVVVHPAQDCSFAAAPPVHYALVSVPSISGQTTLILYLYDSKCDVTYYSDGNHATVVSTGTGLHVDINDAGQQCELAADARYPVSGEGNLSVEVVFSEET